MSFVKDSEDSSFKSRDGDSEDKLKLSSEAQVLDPQDKLQDGSTERNTQDLYFTFNSFACVNSSDEDKPNSLFPSKDPKTTSKSDVTNLSSSSTSLFSPATAPTPNFFNAPSSSLFTNMNNTSSSSNSGGGLFNNPSLASNISAGSLFSNTGTRLFSSDSTTKGLSSNSQNVGNATTLSNMASNSSSVGNSSGFFAPTSAFSAPQQTTPSFGTPNLFQVPSRSQFENSTQASNSVFTSPASVQPGNLSTKTQARSVATYSGIGTDAPSGGFGSAPTSIFGSGASTGIFGSTLAPSSNSGVGNSSNSGFGNPSSTGFGNQSTSGFGNPAPSATFGFAPSFNSGASTGCFSSNPNPSFDFGTTNNSNLFAPQPSVPGGTVSSNTSSNLFASNSSPSGGLFSSTPAPSASFSSFGSTGISTTTPENRFSSIPASSGGFVSGPSNLSSVPVPTAASSSSLFRPNQSPPAMFASSSANPSANTSIFSAQPNPTSSTGLFSSHPNPGSSSSLFNTQPNPQGPYFGLSPPVQPSFFFPPNNNNGFGPNLFSLTGSIPLFEDLGYSASPYPMSLSLNHSSDPLTITLVVNKRDTYQLSEEFPQKYSKFIAKKLVNTSSRPCVIHIDTPFPSSFFELIIWMFYRDTHKLNRYLRSLKDILEVYAVGRQLKLARELGLRQVLIKAVNSGLAGDTSAKFTPVLNRKYVDIDFLLEVLIEMRTGGLFGSGSQGSLFKTAIALEWLGERDLESLDEINELKESDDFKELGEELLKHSILPQSLSDYALLNNRYPVAAQSITMNHFLGSVQKIHRFS